jgi:CHAD domain-containing protein
MNLSSADLRRKAALSPRRDWSAHLDGWRALLAECSQKPTRKRVHLLRVATLRLQAQVQYWLDRHEPADSAVQAARRWNKLARHLRRALGAVRGFDVHLANLARVRSMLTASSGYAPRSSRASLRQIEALQSRFKRNRKAAAKDLMEMLVSRHDRLQHAVAEMAAELALQRSLVPAIPSSRLSEMLSAVVSTFPRLDAKSLHDFRKQLKSVRYLGEVAASGAAARELARTVKSMQGAIGEWHDWEELGSEARRMFGDQGDLAELLKTLVEESLERALSRCNSLTREILSAAPTDTPTLPPRKPMQRAETSAPRRQLISA